MSGRVLIGSIFGILMLAATASHAGTVSFGETLINADLNGTFSVDLRIDFTGDATLGGGLDIFFDSSALNFSSFDFGVAPSLDPSFNRLPNLVLNADPLQSKLEGLAFGSFAGITGPEVIGTLTFQATAVGSSALSLAVTTDPSKGGEFISSSTFSLQVVDFGSAAIQVSAVPVPAAAWLFGGGLIALAGVVKKRKTLETGQH